MHSWEFDMDSMRKMFFSYWSFAIERKAIVPTLTPRNWECHEIPYLKYENMFKGEVISCKRSADYIIECWNIESWSDKFSSNFQVFSPFDRSYIYILFLNEHSSCFALMLVAIKICIKSWKIFRKCKMDGRIGLTKCVFANRLASFNVVLVGCPEWHQENNCN